MISFILFIFTMDIIIVKKYALLANYCKIEIEPRKKTDIMASMVSLSKAQ